MVLVPEEALQRYEQRQRLETSPLMGTMMHKDTQISDILQRDDVPDDEKQKLFNAYFERFLELRRQKRCQLRLKKEEQQAEPQLPDADVVEPIPRAMRPWDKTGQVKIEGEIIAGSNISDLVSDAMRSRRNFNTTGSKEFFYQITVRFSSCFVRGLYGSGRICNSARIRLTNRSVVYSRSTPTGHNACSGTQ